MLGAEKTSDGKWKCKSCNKTITNWNGHKNSFGHIKKIMANEKSSENQSHPLDNDSQTVMLNVKVEINFLQIK